MSVFKTLVNESFIPKLLLRLLWFFRRTAALFRQIRTFPQLFRFCSDLGNPGIRQIVRDSMLTGRWWATVAVWFNHHFPRHRSSTSGNRGRQRRRQRSVISNSLSHLTHFYHPTTILVQVMIIMSVRLTHFCTQAHFCCIISEHHLLQFWWDYYFCQVSALAERLQREIDEAHAQLAVIAMDQEATLEDNECVVCMTSKKQYAFVPCGHVCVCEACAELIDKSTRECPMCCGACTQIMKTYL